MCNHNPPSPRPQLSRFRSLHRFSSNNWENTNRKNLPLTGNNHCNSWLSKNIQFWRNNHSFQNYNLFSMSIVLIFRSNFNAHQFLIPKQLVCVDCYTGRLTFSNTILHKGAIRWILVVSQAEMRKGECVPEVVAYEENLIVINYWREIIYPRVWSPNKTFQYNTGVK